MCLLVQVIRHLDAALLEQPGTYRLQAQLTEAAAGLLEVAEGRVQTWVKFLLDQEAAPGGLKPVKPWICAQCLAEASSGDDHHETLI